MYSAIQISFFLNSKLQGTDFNVKQVSSINNIKENSIIFIKKFREDYLEKLNNSEKDILILCIHDYKDKLLKPHIIVDNPRLSFAKVVSHFFVNNSKGNIHSSANISYNVTIGNNVTIMN